MGTPGAAASIPDVAGSALDRRAETTPRPDEKPKRKKLSDVERALLAERTAATLKRARPGSKEYADACVERAEAGLAVPVMKKTAVDMLSLEQYREVHGEEIRKVTSAPRWGVWVAVTLGIVSVGTVAYVFLGPPPASRASRATASAEAAPPKATTPPKTTTPADVTPAPTAMASSAPSVIVTPAPSSSAARVAGECFDV